MRLPVRRQRRTPQRYTPTVTAPRHTEGRHGADVPASNTLGLSPSPDASPGGFGVSFHVGVAGVGGGLGDPEEFGGSGGVAGVDRRGLAVEQQGVDQPGGAERWNWPSPTTQPERRHHVSAITERYVRTVERHHVGQFPRTGPRRKGRSRRARRRRVPLRVVRMAGAGGRAVAELREVALRHEGGQSPPVDATVRP